MINPINIHTKNHKVELLSGKYHIDILGGWLVFDDSFKIKIENSASQEQVLVQYNSPHFLDS